MIALIVVISMAVLLAGYRLYGGYLARLLKLDDTAITPACQIDDGVDFVPAPAKLLLGQHFSAIAAAGPIVGPILAAIWFGWLPALLWILLGSIFIGGPHDFLALAASVRNKAASIGEIVKQRMSRTSHLLFLVFLWLALVYVIIAFTDITAQTFRTVAQDQAYGPAVAGTSLVYLGLGLLMGVCLYKLKMNLWLATGIFLPLVLASVWLSTRMPAPWTAALMAVPVKGWEVGLLAYCFAASLIPMWLLLQPRGYLGGWFLYLTIITGLLGALFSGFAAQYPALNLAGLQSLANYKYLFPILFITVACGACSGFHGVVSSGTTSKQICRESDTRTVGYGAMLLEALVAVLAIATLMILPKGDALLKGDPNLIYANGLARYLGLVGIDFSLALTFALLAFSTFVYDTLDVCTRLARYIMQELLGIKGAGGAALATLITLVPPLVFLLLAREKAYLVAWPIFGTSNQLMASLILLVLAVWLKGTGRSPWVAIVPMVFMMVVTLASLVVQIVPFLRLLAGHPGAPDTVVSGVCGMVLLVLAAWLVAESVRSLRPAGAVARG